MKESSITPNDMLVKHSGLFIAISLLLLLIQQFITLGAPPDDNQGPVIGTVAHRMHHHLASSHNLANRHLGMTRTKPNPGVRLDGQAGGTSASLASLLLASKRADIGKAPAGLCDRLKNPCLLNRVLLI